MTMRIFYFEGSDGGYERCLAVEHDGTIAYWTSPNRYAAAAGAKGSYETLSVAEAKRRWPHFASKIDDALAVASTSN
jgi:hypothetical protein